MESFGRLVDDARRHKGWGLNRLTVELGKVDGQIMNATQLKRLFEGERRSLSEEWIERFIRTLDLDPAEAWTAARPIPGLTAEALRRVGLFATAGAAAEQARASMPPDSAPAGERRWGTDRRRRCPVRPLRLVPVPLPDLVPGRWAA